MKKIIALTCAFCAVFLFSFASAAFAPAAGDIDRNGETEVTDARQALRAAVGLIALSGDAWHMADADGNEEIEVNDARLILRAAVGLETLPPVSGHRWTDGDVERPASCMTAGVQTQRCPLCGLVQSRSVPATGHTAVTDKAVAATCTTDGKTEGSHCSICGTVLKAQETVKATDHKYDSGKVTKAPTCTAEGEKTYTCTVCKATKTEAIKATGHTAVTDKAVAATCTTDGKTEGSHCAVCGTVLKAQETVKATGHKFDSGKVTKPATCTAEGVKTYTCAVCKATKTEAIKATGHTAVTDKAVAATCTTDGKTEGSHCAVCGTVLKAQETVKATGHKYDSGKVTKAPTCTAEGEKTYTCTVCKATKTEAINATGHTAVTDPAVAATCTSDGKTAGSHCAVCGAVLKAQETVKAAGHQYDAGKVTKPATCTAEGEKTYTCTLCQTEKTEVIAALSHDFIDDREEKASCTEEYAYTRTCRRCGETETLTAGPAGHSFENGAALCVDRTLVCARCGAEQPSFNSLVNELKQGTHFYMGFVRSVGKGEIKPDPQIKISPAARLAARLSGEKLDEKTLLAQLTQELRQTNDSYGSYVGSSRLITDRNFSVKNQAYVSALTSADVVNLTAEDAEGVDFIAALPDTLTVVSADGKTTRTEDISRSVKAAKIGAVKKVTVRLREEKYSDLRDNTRETALQRVTDFDLRAAASSLNHTEDADGMRFEMKCDEAVCSGTVTFYFDAGTLRPVAAVYDLPTVYDQTLLMDAKVGGIQMMSANIGVTMRERITSYYFFDGYFEPKA